MILYTAHVEAVGRHLRRSPQWVRQQCRRLGLGHHEGPTSRRLTAEDVETLRPLAEVDGRVRRWTKTGGEAT